MSRLAASMRWLKSNQYKGWAGTVDDPESRIRRRSNLLGKRYAILQSAGNWVDAKLLNFSGAPILVSNNVKPNTGHDWVWWVNNHLSDHGSTKEEATKNHVKNYWNKWYHDRYGLNYWIKAGVGNPVFHSVDSKNNITIKFPLTGRLRPNSGVLKTAGDTWVDGFEVVHKDKVDHKVTDQNVVSEDATASVKIMSNTYNAQKTADDTAWRAAWMRYILDPNANYQTYISCPDLSKTTDPIYTENPVPDTGTLQESYTGNNDYPVDEIETGIPSFLGNP